VDPKDFKRKVLVQDAGLLDEGRAEWAPVAKNTDQVRDVVLVAVRESKGRISAKRLLPTARTAGRAGSARNFRRLVGVVKKQLRVELGRHQRGLAIWAPATRW
jgi:hypothetical protein